VVVSGAKISSQADSQGIALEAGSSESIMIDGKAQHLHPASLGIRERAAVLKKGRTMVGGALEATTVAALAIGLIMEVVLEIEGMAVVLTGAGKIIEEIPVHTGIMIIGEIGSRTMAIGQ